MNERTFFSLSAITNRVQEIFQPYIGKLFWVKAEISSGRERGGSFYCDLGETKDNGEIMALLTNEILNKWIFQILAPSIPMQPPFNYSVVRFKYKELL